MSIGNHFELLEVHRQQHLQPDLFRAAAKSRQQWKPKLWIVEAVGSGREVYDHIRQQSPSGVHAHRPKLGKEERMAIQSPKIEDGQVHLPLNASWKEGFLADVAAFPNRKYDDQVDSMSQALYALDRRLHKLRHCSWYQE